MAVGGENEFAAALGDVFGNVQSRVWSHAAVSCDSSADRSLCGAVYTQIKRRGSWSAEYEMLCLRSGFGEDRICAVASAVEVMVQTGVLNRSPAGSIVVNEQSPKVNLEDAQLMKHIRSFL